jgi:hypothetical protein
VIFRGTHTGSFGVEVNGNPAPTGGDRCDRDAGRLAWRWSTAS